MINPKANTTSVIIPKPIWEGICVCLLSLDFFFAEHSDANYDAREAATEAIRRLLIWMADAPTLEDRGLRASVALYCLRPDLINGATLESIGDATGRTRQAVFNLAKDFRLTIDAL